MLRTVDAVPAGGNRATEYRSASRPSPINADTTPRFVIGRDCARAVRARALVDAERLLEEIPRRRIVSLLTETPSQVDRSEERQSNASVRARRAPRTTRVRGVLEPPPRIPNHAARAPAAEDRVQGRDVVAEGIPSASDSALLQDSFDLRRSPSNQDRSPRTLRVAAFSGADTFAASCSAIALSGAVLARACSPLRRRYLSLNVERASYSGCPHREHSLLDCERAVGRHPARRRAGRPQAGRAPRHPGLRRPPDAPAPKRARESPRGF